MKIQDLLFIIVVALLIWRRNPKYFVVAGLVCLAASMPLFHFWVFFTAERLVWYAAGFFLIGILFLLRK